MAAAVASLKHLKVSPKEAHTATIIFLHGLGDSGHGWLPVAKALWPSLPNVKWILPHAPTIPISLNRGMRMPGWADLSALDKLVDSRKDDERGLLASVAAVDALIQAEVDAGIPEDRIVLGGFSQGGAITALSLLAGKRKLAGVICLSTWLPLSHNAEQYMADKPDAKDIPVFWGHGEADEVVHFKFGVQSLDLLKKLGFPTAPSGSTFARPGIRFESYPGMGHSSSPREIEDLRAWLVEALK